MLSRPKNGWCLFRLAGWSELVSYVCDAPFILLHAVEFVLCDGGEETAELDGEDREILLTVRPDQIMVTVCQQDHQLVTRWFDLTVVDLARELIRDIRENLEDWVLWPPGSELPFFDRDARRRNLEACCGIIEDLLPKYIS